MSPLGSELGWGEVAVGGVRPIRVVVLTPVLDEDLGFEQRIEVPKVQQLVTHPTVERLNPSVLPRRPGVDEHRVDVVELGLLVRFVSPEANEGHNHRSEHRNVQSSVRLLRTILSFRET